MATHVENVVSNLDGSMTITLVAYMNPAVAATYAGAVVSGVVTNANGSVQMVIQIAPGSPITSQTVQNDPGGSNSAD